MASRSSYCRKFAVYGPALLVDCDVPAVADEVERLLGDFAVANWPEGFSPTTGIIRAYDEQEVLRHLSPTAKPLVCTQELLEVYGEEERFWLIDDRWGMAEINMLKGQWRSWVLPSPKLPPARCAEMSVLWPMAQLLRAKGLHLLPAASVVKNGWAALLVSPFGLEPELGAMARAGYKIIGQRWTAVREENGRLAMLHLPGWVERSPSGIRRGPTAAAGTDTAASAAPVLAEAGWIDLLEEYVDAWQNHAFCNAVLLVEPGRRPHAHLREAGPSAALSALRRAWPITELHPQRRHGRLAPKFAQQCRCFEAQLSRNPKDLLVLLESLGRPPAGAAASDEELRLTPWRGSKPAANAAAA